MLTVVYGDGWQQQSTLAFRAKSVVTSLQWAQSNIGAPMVSGLTGPLVPPPPMPTLLPCWPSTKERLRSTPPPGKCHHPPPLTCHPPCCGVWRWRQQSTLAFGAKSLVVSFHVFILFRLSDHARMFHIHCDAGVALSDGIPDEMALGIPSVPEMACWSYPSLFLSRERYSDCGNCGKLFGITQLDLLSYTRWWENKCCAFALDRDANGKRHTSSCCWKDITSSQFPGCSGARLQVLRQT